MKVLTHLVVDFKEIIPEEIIKKKVFQNFQDLIEGRGKSIKKTLEALTFKGELVVGAANPDKKVENLL